MNNEININFTGTTIRKRVDKFYCNFSLIRDLNVGFRVSKDNVFYFRIHTVLTKIKKGQKCNNSRTNQTP